MTVVRKAKPARWVRKVHWVTWDFLVSLVCLVTEVKPAVMDETVLL